MYSSNKNKVKDYPQKNLSFLKNYNIKKILDILKKNESLARVDLAAISNLDKKTITNITKELFENNQLRVVGRITEVSGRPKEILSLNGDFTYCIGVDLGGTYIAGIVMDFTGKVLCSHHFDLYNNMRPKTLIKISQNLIENLIVKSGLQIVSISGIGISIPGLIDKDTGLSLSENISNWSNVPLKQIFQDKYDVDIYVEDSTRLMALAELWYGAGKDVKDFLLIDLGFGIGCGIVIDQKIFTGSSGKSGGVGHTIVEVDGPQCTCGRHGCIESLASCWALSKKVSSDLKDGKESVLNEIKNKWGSEPAIKDIILASEMGDQYANELLIRAAEYIAIGIANAINFFNPIKVIINGQLIWDNALLMQTIQSTLKLKTMPQIYKDTEIIESDIGVLAPAIGAATLCLQKYYQI